MKTTFMRLRASVGAAKIPRWAWRAVQLLVTLSLLSWLVSRIDSRTVSAVIDFPFDILVVALAVFLSSQIFGALRLWLLLRRQEVYLPLIHLLRLTLIGFFTANFLPSTVGGDLYKTVALTRDGYGLNSVVLTLIADRVLGLITSLLMTAAALVLTDFWRLRPLTTTAHLTEFVAASAAAIFLLVLSSTFILRTMQSRAPVLTAKLRGRLAKVTELSCRFVASPGTVFLSVLFSALSTAAAILAQLLIANYLGIRIGVIEMTAVIGLVTLLTLVPISVNGIGVQEASLVALLQILGTAQEPAIAFAIFSRVLILGTSVLGALLLMFYSQPAKSSH
jgi:uncharacterized protein (TIRG00374 family)